MSEKKDDSNWFPWHANCNHTMARSGVGQSGYGFAAPSKLRLDMESIFLLFAICCLLHKCLLLGLHCGFNSVQE